MTSPAPCLLARALHSCQHQQRRISMPRETPRGTSSTLQCYAHTLSHDIVHKKVMVTFYPLYPFFLLSGGSVLEAAEDVQVGGLLW